MFRRPAKGGQTLFSGLTMTFLREFLTGLWLTLPLLLALAAAIAFLGQVVGKKEGWLPLDSLYWAFITATTVGFGDIRPTSGLSKILSILVGFAGLILSR